MLIFHTVTAILALLAGFPIFFSEKGRASLKEQVLEKAHQLERFPRLGRIVPEIGDASIRELIYRSYRIMYFVDQGRRVIRWPLSAQKPPCC